MITIEQIESPKIMGIINLTPDSFYEKSRCTTDEQFCRRYEQMLAEGVDIIDIGACSTRPGSKPVSPEEEWELLKPALKRVLRDYPASEISIDTFRSSIVELAFDFVGDFIVNDISAGEDDPGMLPMVAKLELPYIAMHKRGTPETMQTLCQYDNVTEDVRSYFLDFVKRANDLGINQLILDPGFGFAKTVEQNYELFCGLDRMKIETGKTRKYYPVLVGISRKSMIYRYLGSTPDEVLHANSALHLQALLKGADILRVHDVKEAVEVLKLYEIITKFDV
ncbi:MAG: dihydropteroate synthase [Bacteroidales bacterium]